MGEEEGEELGLEIVREKGAKLEEDKKQVDENVLGFLDSMDAYLTLHDSLYSRLREGWLDLASARHSMGASRVNHSLLDLKFHTAATSLQVTEHDDGADDSVLGQPHFTLRKWGSLNIEKCCSMEHSPKGDDTFVGKLGSPVLRNRGDSPSYGKTSENGVPLEVDDQVQKERARSLSVFGTLVSPKLRAAQLSFETALETIVEIANMNSAMLSTFDQVQNKSEVSKRAP